MKTSYRIALSLTVAAIAGGSAYWLALRLDRGPAQQEPSAQPKLDAPEALLTGIEVKHMEGGKPAWVALLDEVDLQAGGSAIAARGLQEAIIYDTKGVPALRLTAKQVKGDANRKDFEVMGDVVVTSPKGFVITTQTMQWVNDDQRIHCPGPVIIKTKNLVVTTTLLDYLLETGLVKCPNQVRLHSGNTKVAGRSLTYDVNSRKWDAIDVEGVVVDPEEAKKVLKELGDQ